MSGFDAAAVATAADSAAVLMGLGLPRAGGRYGCPACGLEREEGKRRGPVSVFRRNDGRSCWRCWACQAGGDAVDAVRAAGHDVAAWFACAATKAQPRRPQLVPHERPRVAPSEAGALWARCRPLTGPARQYLRSKEEGIDPDAVDWHEVRCLPLRGDLPAWAAGWGRHDRSHRMVLPLWRHDGRGAGLHCRTRSADRRWKSLRMGGVDCRGLLLASRAAVLALRGTRPVEAWLVTEGDCDFLAATAANPCVAVLGLNGDGAWQAPWAPVLRGLPGRVFVRCDSDNGGDKHTARVLRDLPEAVDIRPPRTHPAALDLDKLPPERRSLAALLDP